MPREHRRRNDDAHRPMGGRGQRANAQRSPFQVGAACLVLTPTCKACGQLMPHGYFGCAKDMAATA